MSFVMAFFNCWNDLLCGFWRCERLLIRICDFGNIGRSVLGRSVREFKKTRWNVGGFGFDCGICMICVVAQLLGNLRVLCLLCRSKG